MKPITTLVSLTFAALLITACSSQQDRRPPRGGDRGADQASFEGYAAKPIALLFVSMDQDQDARTDDEELLSGIARAWDSLSLNQPVGALEYGEWSATSLGSPDALPSFIAFDRDLDGRLSELEFEDRLRAEFVELDKDGNGTLERSELIFRIARPSRQQQGGEQGRGGQEGRRPPRR
ncbi:MAG: signal transduction protein [Pseudomonadota bacterium]